MQLELNERQRTALGAAITIVSVCVILAASGALVYLIALFAERFSAVLLPLAVAGVMALVVRPYYEWFHERRGVAPWLAVTCVFVSIALPILAFLWFFGAVLAGQIAEAIQQAPQTFDRLRAWTEERLPAITEFWQRYELSERMRQVFEGKEGSIVTSLQAWTGKAFAAGANVLKAIAALLGWVVVPVYFAFFLIADMSWISAERLLPFLKKDTRDDVAYLVHEFVAIIVAFFRGQLLIAFLQGVLFAIGFTAVGLKYGLLLGLMLGFLNVVPYLGSIIGLSICLPLALFQDGGGWGRLAAVIAVFTAVQMIEGYVLTPRIMGDRTGLHPMVIIIAIFFWGSALGGITGMVLAVPLTAFLVVFWRLARDKYIHEIV